jgi:hypothetical protein
MHWAEASLLELLDFKIFKFFPLKLELLKSGLVLLVLDLVSWFSGTSVFLVFWYFLFSGFLVPIKLGFDFLEAFSTERVCSSCQKFH